MEAVRACVQIKGVVQGVGFRPFVYDLALENDLKGWVLNDEKGVVQCAREVGDIEHLKMLYLLTWADSMATGPRAWNEWIANLVQELFFKILHILERGELATPDAARLVKKTKAKVRHEIADKMPKEDLEGYFEVMSPRYELFLPH